ncbi:MAG: hypothetical protein ACREXG_01780 [Polaromonas sp.]
MLPLLAHQAIALGRGFLTFERKGASVEAEALPEGRAEGLVAAQRQRDRVPRRPRRTALGADLAPGRVVVQGLGALSSREPASAQSQAWPSSSGPGPSGKRVQAQSSISAISACRAASCAGQTEAMASNVPSPAVSSL